MSRMRRPELARLMGQGARRERKPQATGVDEEESKKVTRILSGCRYVTIFPEEERGILILAGGL